MATLNTIQTKLAELNPVEFEMLCNAYLQLKNRSCSSFCSYGIMTSKEKTKAGTPDYFFIKPNGRYVFVQYTTDASKGYGKVEQDILDCLNEDKTGIPVNMIDEIIICINFQLSPQKIHKAQNLVKIACTIYTLETIAQDINFSYQFLAAQYLNLPINTGQLVLLDSFVEHYENLKGFSTTISNRLINREKELSDLQISIDSNQITIVAGSAGVGKTKLCIEGIRKFIELKPEYIAYGLLDHNTIITDDLNQLWQSHNKVIVFIDDANRISTIKQLLGFAQSEVKEGFKLIMTIRSYGMDKLNIAMGSKYFSMLTINPLSREHIETIIKEFEPSDISWSESRAGQISYRANGNPRLAIMYSLFDSTDQNGNLISITGLFNLFFDSFAQDDPILNEPGTIKILGLISFLNAVNINSKDEYAELFGPYDIDYKDFRSTIESLNRLEIVSIRFDYVKIPEQILANFFFYKAFLLDKALSIERLFEHFFHRLEHRFRDTFIPMLDNFIDSYDDGDFKMQLKSYWEKINDNESAAVPFLKIFGKVFPSELLQYLYEKVKSNPVSSSSDIFEELKSQHQPLPKHDYVALLEILFESKEDMETGIQLGFDLLSRFPSMFKDFVNALKSHFIFTRGTGEFNYLALDKIFAILEQGIQNGHKYCIQSYNDFGFTFLQYYNREVNTFTLDELLAPAPGSSVHHYATLRKYVWEIMALYSALPDGGYREILARYQREFHPHNTDIIRFDISYIIRIQSERLDSSIYADCKLVLDQIEVWEDKGVLTEEASQLRRKFQSDIHDIYMILRRDRIGKSILRRHEDLARFKEMKEKQIRGSLVLHKPEDVTPFVLKLTTLFETIGSDIDPKESLDYVIDQNCIENLEIGIKLLIGIMEASNVFDLNPSRTISNHIADSMFRKAIRARIEDLETRTQCLWVVRYYNASTDKINESDLSLLLKSIKETEIDISIRPSLLLKFVEKDSKIFEKVLSIVNEKYNVKFLRTHLDPEIFYDHYDKLGTDVELIEGCYIQQFSMHAMYDYNGKALYSLIERNQSFLLKFVKSAFIDHNPSISDVHSIHLHSLWTIDGIEETIEKVFELDDNDPYSFGFHDTLYQAFFLHLEPGDNKGKAAAFIVSLVNKHHGNPRIMNKIVDVTRKVMKDCYEDVINTWLSQSNDIETFKKIKWRGAYTMGGGDQILAEIEEGQWRKVLSLVKEFGSGIELIPIRKYLEDRITYCQLRAKDERLMQFLGHW